MPVTNPPVPPVRSTMPTPPPTIPSPEALTTAVRQHGALGSRLLAEYWRREGTSPALVDQVVAAAVPALRVTSVRDVALARREPAPFPPDVSGGPLDDLYGSPAAMAADRVELQRFAFESRTFGQCLGAEIGTYGARGLEAIDGAITQFAARHVDELMRMGDSASEAVGDLVRILAGEPDTLAERQRAVILRLLSPRPGERFHGIGPETRAALALAVLADDSAAANPVAGEKGIAIAELVAGAAPIAKRMAGRGDVSHTRTAGSATQGRVADEAGVDVDAEPDPGPPGHSL